MFRGVPSTDAPGVVEPDERPMVEALCDDEEGDESLLARISKGDRAALGSLYDRHANRLVGFAHWHGLAKVDAMDVVHDVFLEIWQHAGDFDPSRGSVPTWMYLRMRSRIVDHHRKVSRQRASPMPTFDGISCTNDGQSNHDNRLYLKRLLTTLPDNQRQVLILALLEDFSLEEIARRLSIPFGTVKSRLGRALARLREKRGG